MIDLSELGLTKNETKALRKLLTLGKSSAAIISRESGVPYSRIYDVLASLEQKGLVKVIPEKGKKFIPSDPEVLKNLIKSKRQSLDELEKEIEKLKILYEMKEKEPVEIARGKRNFYKLIKELPKAHKIVLSVKYTAEYKPEWARIDKERIKKGLEIKDLVRVDEETIDNLKKWLKVNKNIRELPNEGVAISLRDDATILITLIKSNTILLIRDKPFINLMKVLLRKYYESANPVKV